MSNQKTLKDLTWGEYVKNHIVPEFPKFKVRLKSASFLMKFYSWFLFFVSFGQIKRENYMQKTATVVGNTLYVGDAWTTRQDHFQAILTLVHEKEHLIQKKKNGTFWHSVKYMFWKFPFFWADYRLQCEAQAMASALVYGYKVYELDLWNEKFNAAIKALSSSLYFWASLNKKKVNLLLRKEIIKRLIKSNHG